jgi:aspartate aminotransferase-like enzyme
VRIGEIGFPGQLSRHCERSEAIQEGIERMALESFAALAMTMVKH